MISNCTTNLISRMSLEIFYRYHKPLYENKQIVYPHGYGKHLVSNNHKRTDATFIIYTNGKNYRELYEQM